jgi:putative endonuclease
VTSDLVQRVHEHKTKVSSGFSKKYNTCLLVWYELHDDIESAIVREKQLKKWNRPWKIRLIEEKNPEWTDLFPTLIE